MQRYYYYSLLFIIIHSYTPKVHSLLDAAPRSLNEGGLAAVLPHDAGAQVPGHAGAAIGIA